jgi:uncharacterized protein (DUF1330 family)
MSVDPTGEDIRRFLEEDDGGPVVMLNLLRYAGEEGKGSYQRYAREVVPFLGEVGAEVLYAGDVSTTLVAPEGHDWDAVLVVRYPSRKRFLDMVTNPEYQAITRLRSEGLETAVLEATRPWGG